MRQVRVALQTHYYMLQPGNGTRYQFFITRPGLAEETYNFHTSDGDPPKTYDVIDGCGPNTVLFGILGTPRANGIYIAYEYDLENLHRRHVSFLCQQTGAQDKHTVTAVALAVGVLANDVHDLDGACEAMLRAGEILAG